MIGRPQPLAETPDTVTYRKADVHRLFEQLEDLEARGAHAVTRDEEKLPADVVKRLCAGESLVRIFREHRGLSVTDLARRAGLSRSYLSAIETGRKRPSAKALNALAESLDISVEDMII